MKTRKRPLSRSFFVLSSRSHFLLLNKKKKKLRPSPSTVWISGALQTGLYLDFFYYYLRAWRNNEKLSLPS